MAAKLGIIAGGGTLPALVAAACEAVARPYVVIALKGVTEEDWLEGRPHHWIRLGAPGRGIRHLRAAGAEDLVMIGAVRRPSIVSLRPDAWLAGRLLRLGKAAFNVGDDAFMRLIDQELAAEGFRVIGADGVLADLLATAGPYGHVRPDAQAEADIARGLAVARGIGALDVGQAVVVQQGLVLGVEAVEGTDALLARCATLRREGVGGVLIKACKPRQDRRFDLPTVGPTTIENAARAGLRGVAVEAGRTLIVDRDRAVAAADAAGLFIIGVAAATDDGT